MLQTVKQRKVVSTCPVHLDIVVFHVLFLTQVIEVHFVLQLDVYGNETILY